MTSTLCYPRTPRHPRLCKDRFFAFWRDESGATAIEYALIASLVAVVIIGAVTTLGGSVSAMFDNTANAMQ